MNSPPSRHKKATSPASTDSTSAASSVNEDVSQQVNPSSALQLLLSRSKN
nr:hypothetical protein [Nostoc sp. 'Peltigera malacea cyanobiont' DB3992]